MPGPGLSGGLLAGLGAWGGFGCLGQGDGEFGEAVGVDDVPS